MTQNIIKLASLKASFRYEKLALKTLESQNSVIEKELSNVPASASSFLMQREGMVTLKNSKKVLENDFIKIKSIRHPYLLIKEDKTEGKYLACTMRSCFAIEKEFKTIKKAIEDRIEN